MHSLPVGVPALTTPIPRTPRSCAPQLPSVQRGQVTQRLTDRVRSGAVSSTWSTRVVARLHRTCALCGCVDRVRGAHRRCREHCAHWCDLRRNRGFQQWSDNDVSDPSAPDKGPADRYLRDVGGPRTWTDRRLWRISRVGVHECRCSDVQRHSQMRATNDGRFSGRGRHRRLARRFWRGSEGDPRGHKSASGSDALTVPPVPWLDRPLSPDVDRTRRVRSTHTCVVNARVEGQRTLRSSRSVETRRCAAVIR